MPLKETNWSKHRKYLDECLDLGFINQIVYDQSINCAAKLQNSLGIPASCTGPDGQMFYAWNSTDMDRRHHFEIAIQPDGLLEVFYRNRVTGKTYFDEFYKLEDLLRSEATAYIRLLKLEES
jgi:hypothetical protein